MKPIALLLILAAVQFPAKTVAVDCLECNHYGNGNVQLIAWQNRPERAFPIDWVTPPRGEFSNGAWHDANGKTVIAREYIETVTPHDPERAAFYWWRAKGDCSKQGGIWK